MTEYKKCPDCKGAGVICTDPNPYWQTDMDYAKPMKSRKCETCRGEGKLSPLAYACRVAGGPPSNSARGFA